MEESVLPWELLLELLPRSAALCRGVLGNGKVPGYVITTGSGPCFVSEFDSFLRECGLQAIEPDNVPEDCAIGIMVVGHEDWTAEELNSVVEAHAGGSLRVYSQEMVLASLALGADVFDLCVQDDLALFGEGHPALEYLSQERGFDWPTTDVAQGPAPVTVNFSAFDSPETGLLRHMGYGVGKTSTLSASERRAILDHVMRILIRPATSVDQVFADEWGDPMSSDRLHKAANCIASFTRLKKLDRSRDNSVAIAEWESDLEYLRGNYYDRLASRFRWPDTKVV